MPDKPLRNVGASVRARLLNLSKQRNQPFDLLLTRYALVSVEDLDYVDGQFLLTVRRLEGAGSAGPPLPVTLPQPYSKGKVYFARFFYGNGTALEVKHSEWRDRGLGVLPDLGSHLLDMTLFLFGRPDAGFHRSDLQEYLDGVGVDSRTIWTGNVTLGSPGMAPMFASVTDG